jgi:hypothetical protein
MDSITWGIIAVLAVLGGWLGYRRAQRSGKWSRARYLTGFLVAIAIVVLLSLIVTLIQQH